MRSNESAKRLSLLDWTTIGCALVVALGLRAYHLGTPDFWLDELHSLSNSAGWRAELEALPHGILLQSAPRFTELTGESTVTKAWHTMRHDGHPPLYFVLLLAWRRLVGDGEFAVRFLSVLLSVASILPAALMAREWGRARLAPWVAFVLAFSFGHIRMAQENRPYALSILLVTVATWLLVRMERRRSHYSTNSAVPTGLTLVEGDSDPALKCGATFGRPSGTQSGDAVTSWKESGGMNNLNRFAMFPTAASYAVVVWLAMMNHYFAALALLAHGMYAALRFRGNLLRGWMIAVGAAAAIWMMTWGAVFLSQRDFIAAQDWLREDRADHVFRSFIRFLDLPVRLLFDHEVFALTTGKALIGAAILVGAAIVVIRKRLQEAWLPALWVLCPMVAFLVIDLATGRQMLSHLRYTSVVVPGLAILLVFVVAELPKVWRAALAVTFFLTSALLLSLPTPQNPHSREAAALLAANVRPGEPVIYDAIEWPRFWASSMYLTVSYYQPEPMAPVVLLRESPSTELLRQLESYPRLHVISPRVGVDVNPLPERFERVSKSEHIEGIGWGYVFEERELRTEK